MGHFFNGWGSYFDRLAKAKERKPNIAKKYDALSEERRRLEKLASDTWGIMGLEKEAYLSKRDFMKEKVYPLDAPLEALWQRLFDKSSPDDEPETGSKENEPAPGCYCL